jgi:hypothetical protein
MDSRDLDACPECGHWSHPTDGNGCSVIWMGERCGCRWPDDLTPAHRPEDDPEDPEP